MTALIATGWALGTTFFFLVLVSVLASFRPGVLDDVVTQVACQAIAYLLAIFLMLRVHAPSASIRDFIGARPTSPLFYPLAVLLGVAMSIPTNAFYDVIDKRWPTKDEDVVAKLFLGEGAPMRALIALVVVVCGPVIEEVLFRGALFRPMRKTLQGWMVVVVTAVLFGIVHLSPQKLLPIAMVGLVLGVTRLASGSLLPSMLAHAAFNAMPFVALVTQKQGTAPADVPVPLWLVAATSAATLVLLAAVRVLGARAPSALQAQEADLR
jgi:membrane protease YdiL (CAAX protease family)